MGWELIAKQSRHRDFTFSASQRLLAAFNFELFLSGLYHPSPLITHIAHILTDLVPMKVLCGPVVLKCDLRRTLG